jgi:hypothetical protein
MLSYTEHGKFQAQVQGFAQAQTLNFGRERDKK